MRVHRLLHETTCRLELAALQKGGAVDRLTFNATIIETGAESATCEPEVGAGFEPVARSRPASL